MAMTSVRIASRGAAYFRGEQIGDIANAALAVAELQDFDRDLVGRQHALGRQDHPDLSRLIELQLGMPRQHRPGLLR